MRKPKINKFQSVVLFILFFVLLSLHYRESGSVETSTNYVINTWIQNAISHESDLTDTERILLSRSVLPEHKFALPQDYYLVYYYNSFDEDFIRLMLKYMEKDNSLPVFTINLTDHYLEGDLSRVEFIKRVGGVYSVEKIWFEDEMGALPVKKKGD